MSKLTDNQKAATYIGWQPCEICARWEHFAMHEGAPDMTRPENLWKLHVAINGQPDEALYLIKQAVALYDAEHQENPE